MSLIARKAWILACRGAVEEAAALKDRFLPRGRDIGDPQVVANVLAIAALIEQAAGRPDAALGLVEELEVATRDGPGCYRADPLPTVARICAAAGQPELAGRFLAGADAPAARWDGFGVTLEPGQALLGLGRCATRLGQPAGRDRLLQARGVFDRLGAPALLAETDRWLLEATARPSAGPGGGQRGGARC